MSDAALAVLAAARGAGVVVSVRSRDEVLERLLDDLHCLGGVELLPPEDPSPLAGLTVEQWCLLVLLSRGRTVTEAARVLHLARRTAVRRLAEARAVLGVATNLEAVIVVRGLPDEPTAVTTSR
jgi:DNA-binding NarL/FixJ family response regulator